MFKNSQIIRLPNNQQQQQHSTTIHAACIKCDFIIINQNLFSLFKNKIKLRRAYVNIRNLHGLQRFFNRSVSNADLEVCEQVLKQLIEADSDVLWSKRHKNVRGT